MAIEILSKLVIDQIAAGEVVERPTSVVKELLENALDAEARTVRVSIQEGGQKLMRISDDGLGIPASDVEMAFMRHATSKLRGIDDLQTIHTLGFRGEALASIAAVSHVQVMTRHHEEETGTRLLLEGGEITLRQTVGTPIGTVISVENLFFNTPARLKFQKKEATERRQIASLVTHYAMAYPHVRFILDQDNREVFRSSGSGQLADVVVKSLGLDSFKRMVEVYGEHEDIRVIGYTSTPDFYRSDRGRITLFVNGRYVQDSSLNYAVVQAYHTLMATGRYPISILLIDLPSQEVDVNVHPTKAEVRFRDPNRVFSAVQRAVRQSVIGLSQTPYFKSTRPNGNAGDVNSPWSFETDAEAIEPGSGQLSMPLGMNGSGRYASQTDSRRERRVAQRNAQNEDDELDLSGIPVGAGSILKPRTLPVLRVVGQVGAMYIVAEGPAGMYLIDQHAAHERILYEQVLEEFNQQQPMAQFTLDAQTIDLAPAEARLVEEHQEALANAGFLLEPFGMNTFLIRSIPAMLAKQDPVESIAGIIDDLELAKQPGMKAIEDQLIRYVCKRAAVKAGQILSIDEMQSLIRQLERCEAPHTCPHGRPTMLHMSGDQLAREFGRSR
jgi:DNA mismatch repair protein MutL